MHTYIHSYMHANKHTYTHILRKRMYIHERMYFISYKHIYSYLRMSLGKLISYLKFPVIFCISNSFCYFTNGFA